VRDGPLAATLRERPAQAQPDMRTLDGQESHGARPGTGPWRVVVPGRLARRLLMFGALVAACAPCLAASQTAAANDVAGAVAPSATRPAPVARPRARNRQPGAGLEDRIQLLTAELELDSKQQQDVRKLLEEQRAQVQRVWSDNSVPSVQRVAATKAISDKTADGIRELLNDEQRKKYTAARQPRAAGDDDARQSLEYWMNASRPR
jgi:TolA-binding protein